MADRHHALIAGTGRAGTSFLVRFLVECGVPAGDLDELDWSDDASAGLERNLLDSPDVYLVKDPWFADYLHLVDLDELTIDVLVLPVPGGAIHSLSVQDQERVLAVGQATLIAWALEHSVPLVLLHHPRLVRDPDYLVDALWPWLGRFCDRGTARAAFDRVAAVREWSTDAVGDDGTEPDSDLVVDLRAQVEGLATALERVKAEVAAVRQDRDDLGAAARAEQVKSAALVAALDQQLTEARAALAATREHAEHLAAHVAHVEGALASEAARAAAVEERAAALANEVDALRRSHAYRVGHVVTAPVRAARRTLR